MLLIFPARMLTKALAQATSAGREAMDAVSRQVPVEYATGDAPGACARPVRVDDYAIDRRVLTGIPRKGSSMRLMIIRELVDEVDSPSDRGRNVLGPMTWISDGTRS